MTEEETCLFRRSTTSFVINALLLCFFFFMFILGISREYMAAILVAFAAALWQVTFTVWLLMYPFARMREGRITFYARYQQRRAFDFAEVAGVTRTGNDLEIALRDGSTVALSLFWMNPADRDPLIQLLQSESSTTG
jgi:hypothetical protein